jgi:hypothetical protein
MECLWRRTSDAPAAIRVLTTKPERKAMKTKTIFNLLALAMLMPAMLLTTACSNEDDAVVNNEQTIKKGYPLQVTVNVSREGDGTTRATYNEGTKTLSFSADDQLFVQGSGHPSAGQFAGTLTMESEGTFSGTIYTQYMFSGTSDALLAGAGMATATLLPAGYDTYDFLVVNNPGTYSADLGRDFEKAFANSKAAAVEQFSYEYAGTYSSGFTLSPQSAILNFTITGLTASTEVTASFKEGLYNNVISGNVTTDGSGNATFAVGVDGNTDLNDCALTVGGNAITLVNSSKTLARGHVYNITRTAPAAP